MMKGENTLKNKPKIVIAASLAISAISLMATGALAFFSDAAAFEKQSGEIGTVQIADINLQIADNDGQSSNSLTNWAPGDVNTISWVVENTGTKSIATRNTLYIYWDDDMNEFSEKDDVVYLYPQNMSNKDIQEEMFDKNVSSKIDIGQPHEFNINGKTHTGWSYMVTGDILDGVGDSAETGDAFETNYDSLINDTSDIYDSISYKLALSNYANVHTMNKPLKIAVVTEAMQARNTADSSWETVAVKEISIK